MNADFASLLLSLVRSNSEELFEAFNGNIGYLPEEFDNKKTVAMYSFVVFLQSVLFKPNQLVLGG